MQTEFELKVNLPEVGALLGALDVSIFMHRRAGKPPRKELLDLRDRVYDMLPTKLQDQLMPEIGPYPPGGNT